MLHKNILKIRDESALGEVFNESTLCFDKLDVSVEDIITERVYQEVAKANQQLSEYKHLLVTPTKEEQLLNQESKKKRHINPEKQVEVALRAFEGNGFFMLIDDLQAESLAQMVSIKPETMISFVKLTPLVGG